MLWDRARSKSLLWVAGLAVLAAACGDGAASDAMSPATSDSPADSRAHAAATTALAGSGASATAGTGAMSARAAANTAAGAAQAGAGHAGAAGPASSGAPGDPSTAAASNTPPNLTPLGPGTCCPDGKCLCRAEPPAALSGDKGPHTPMLYELAAVGCAFYPADAPPPYAAVAMADGFGGSGGCDSVQIGEWGPFYASHGIVALIIDTGTGDQASARGEALRGGITALKAENEKAGSPLFGKLAGRYGSAGFSMGGGGSGLAAAADKSLLSSVAIMPWNTSPAADGGNVPSLIICGASDGVAPCSAHGTPAYAKLGMQTPKMRVTVASDYNGQPSAAMGASGGYALAFQKLFLEGDERWRPLLVMAKSDETTIK